VKYSILVFLLGCNMGPRVADIEIDSSIPQPIDAPPGSPRFVLPPDAVVPSTADSLELQTQIQFNDGLVDATLLANNGVIVRGTGKSNGTTVRFWHFGPFVIDSFSVLAPAYILGTDNAGVFTPLPDHLPMLDTLPGDLRYSAIRRVVKVPVTAAYAGEKITSLDALNEAIELGLVGEPDGDGTWVNMPIVPPGTKLEVGPGTANIPAKKVYARGFLADAFELGITNFGRQPLRLGIVDVRQASFLLTGVPTGTPPILPTTADAQPVFQVTIPTVAPVLVPPAPNYSPLCQDVSVRLASGVEPVDITADGDLFRRTASGTMNGYRADNVDSFTIGTVVNNIQIQFVEGQP
jgi:hypothetical protein